MSIKFYTLNNSSGRRFVLPKYQLIIVNFREGKNSSQNAVEANIKMCFWIPRARAKPISDDEVRSRIRETYNICFVTSRSSSNTQSHNLKILRSILSILQASSRNQLQQIGPRDIIYCVVTIFFYFEANLHRSNSKCYWKRRRDYEMSQACYSKVLESFIPEKSRELVYSLVNVLHKEKLWHCEDLCSDLAFGLLEHGISGSTITHALLNQIESENTSAEESRTVVRILYEILDVYFWPTTEETNVAIERLLQFYYHSLNTGPGVAAPKYATLRKGFEVCIRHMIKHLKNSQLLVIIYHMCSWSINDNTVDSTILDFGSTLEYAAYAHESCLFKDTFPEDIFNLLMKMISSKNRLISLLGNRVMQYLLDRNDNRSQFDTPKIFFERMHFDIKINKYEKEDKYFLQKIRQVLHDNLVKSMIFHSSTRLNLESTYCTICLIAIEIPCGFTAAAIVCLAMNLQDLTLAQSVGNREISYHVHATVVAIMSLLCWIHEARVFYAYVNKIITERAQWAPHLNPPVKASYSFAVHHVMWDKAELFFVDWETRYGLWKCFRGENRRRSTDASVNHVGLRK